MARRDEGGSKRDQRSSDGGGGSRGRGAIGLATSGFGGVLLSSATSMLSKVATHVAGADAVDGAAASVADGGDAISRARAQIDTLKAQVVHTTRENDALNQQVGFDIAA